MGLWVRGWEGYSAGLAPAHTLGQPDPGAGVRPISLMGSSERLPRQQQRFKRTRSRVSQPMCWWPADWGKPKGMSRVNIGGAALHRLWEG